MPTSDQATHRANSLNAEVLPSLPDWQQNPVVKSDIPWSTTRSQYLTTDVHFILKYSFQFEEPFISIWRTPVSTSYRPGLMVTNSNFYFRKIFISPLFEEQFCHLQYMYFVVIFLSILWLIIPLSPGLQDFCREKCIYTISGVPKFVMSHFSHVILKILSLSLTFDNLIIMFLI